uniref:Chorion peroxidase n=1 Tax=Daphnia magna TaxID=35525 RepID=A0A0P5PNQ9_9CRUS
MHPSAKIRLPYTFRWLLLCLILIPVVICQYQYHQNHAYSAQLGVSNRPDLSYVFSYPFNLYRTPGGEPWCPSAGPNKPALFQCKPAIRCSPWFIELLYNPWWCTAADGSFGACCPDVYKTTASVARFPESSKLTAMPRDITKEEMTRAVTVARKHVEEISAFEWHAWSNMLAPWQNSAAYSYSATTYASLIGQQQGWKGLQSVEASRKLANLLKLEPEYAGFALQHLCVRETALSSICCEQPKCNASALYRTYDASCNNIDYPNWGRSNSPLERILPPQYADGIWAPREWPGLPTVDSVSRIVQDIDYPDNQLTITVMHWGQMIAHDVTHVPTFRTLNNSAIQCCTGDGKYLSPERTHPLCFPIDVAHDNEFYGQFGVTCHDFVRSVIAPREDCKFGYADQLNQNTAYLDASVIYGSTEKVARSLREYAGGRMRVTIIGGDYVILPVDPNRKDCITDEYGGECFVGGDQRVNQYTGLTVLHIVWVRLHNKYANQLSLINPSWDDERLYQETKKIITALVQHITYNEYLPSVLGPNLMGEYGLLPLTTGYTYTYDPAVKAQVTNEFATAAFRYGHSLIRNYNELWLDDTYANYGGELYLKDWYNNPKVLFDPIVFNALIRHSITGTAQNFDENVVDAVHNYLFKSPYQSWGLDLIAANLWRGRDHGIPGYNFYLEACGSKRAATFDDLLPIMRPAIVEKIKYLYKSVDDVDLFIGVLGEWAIKGGIVGPVTSCIMADQFARLKDGDRFFYEHGGQSHSFTPAQLDSIRSMSLARVLCETSDTVDWITPNVFWTPSPMNPWVPCYGKDIPRLNLNLWKSTY